jgi:predicted PP-loop superfamily ATPase
MVFAVATAFVGDQVIGIADDFAQPVVRDIEQRNRGLELCAISRSLREHREQFAVIDGGEDCEDIVDGAQRRAAFVGVFGFVTIGI